MSTATAAAVSRPDSHGLHLELGSAIGEVGGTEVPVFSPHGVRMFTWDELGQLTDNYSQGNFVGETKFTKLYRGKMETREVAVKIFTDSSSPSGADSDSASGKDKHSRFRDEMLLLQHPSIKDRQRNLAKLIGVCPECLGVVYDANPRETLDKLIVKDGFTWLQRVKVALQLASLLAFFHDYDPPFILRNIDAAQIMVDQDYDLVLFEFGELVGGFLGNSKEIPNGKVKGLGYVDFHILLFVGWSTTHDVFSYGILLLSLIAKRLLDACWSETSVVLWAKKGCKEKMPWLEIERNDSYVHELFKDDPDYDVHDAKKIIKLAMSCIDLLPKDRPTMKDMHEFMQVLHVVLLNGIRDTGKSELVEILPCQLREITSAFSCGNLLGKTQFGKLYRGKISHGGNQNEERAVTVKIWDDSRGGSADPMETWSKLTEEVYLLQHSSVNCHQQNLAKPIGYSCKSEVLGIVYDLNPRDTLHHLILRDDFKWIQRIKVALQLARLLVFFHTYNPTFIVRNICAAHILVDQDYNPILFDFGMLVGGFFGSSDIPNGKLHGTPGYIDLHYLTVGEWSTTCDVFSYGVLLLSLFAKKVLDISEPGSFLAPWTELRCKKNISRFRIYTDVSHVNEIFKKHPDYNAFDAFKIMKLALSCVLYAPEDRPTMKQIYESLQALFVVQHTGMGDPGKSLLREYLPRQLREYTGGFCVENFLGNTQFAKLYRGRISDDAGKIHVVTVKIWDDSLPNSGDSDDKWSKMMDEVYLVQHHSVNDHQPNLATPIGYSHNCPRPGILYDLNPKDTLHKEILKNNFKWLQRIRVALQLARLLVFFHNYDPPCVLRNISADHILVDQEYNALLFDFGMMVGGLFGNARDIPQQQLYSPPGYLDSSFHILGRMDMKSDVYAFGVILLSLLTKMVAFDTSRRLEPRLAAWVRKDSRGRRNKESLDRVFRRAHKMFKKDRGYDREDALEMTRLAMLCSEESPYKRPTMRDVLERLQELDAVLGFSGELAIESEEEDHQQVCCSGFLLPH